MKNFEIERKFLVKYLPELSNCKSEQITQAYISLDPEVRVRKKGEKYFRTEKSGYGVVRKEYETEISEQEYKSGYNLSCGRVVEKTRYYIPCGKYTAELDIYSGKHKGLVVCEVEFNSEDEAKEFVPPEWFGKDISEDKNYRNKILAQKETV